ncbi:hypothetical protein NKDENANG_02771 [Candidatus Entotheonellaceae bacterium PAL068K]
MRHFPVAVSFVCLPLSSESHHSAFMPGQVRHLICMWMLFRPLDYCTRVSLVRLWHVASAPYQLACARPSPRARRSTPRPQGSASVSPAQVHWVCNHWVRGLPAGFGFCFAGTGSRHISKAVRCASAGMLRAVRYIATTQQQTSAEGMSRCIAMALIASSPRLPAM